jgi:hypothetical protein
MLTTNRRLRIWLLLGLLAIIAAACGPTVDEAPAQVEPTPSQRPVPEAIETAEPGPTPSGDNRGPDQATDLPATSGTQQPILTEDDRSDRLRSFTGSWQTNWQKHTIPTSQIDALIPRDNIPSIDNPQFVSAEDAAAWLADNEPVLAFEHNGDARAYPLQILTWHEIVNDLVGDQPVAITYCPLCNSAIVFDSELDGQHYEFGTSGLLRFSDLIMYDRTTESLWQQFTGEAIVGDLTGNRLTFLPSSIVSFADFRQAHPEGQILSRDTGFSRPYGENPYVGYDSGAREPFAFRGIIDERLPATERVTAVSFDEVSIAYPRSIVAEMGIINDTRAGQDLAVFHRSGTSTALGSADIAQGEDIGATAVFDPSLNGQKLTFTKVDNRIVDDQTGSTWNILGQAVEGPLAGEELTPIVHGDYFWFAWAIFQPDTEVYGQ